MLWIHGGGNSIGRAGFYDGGNLAATHDVVVVAINYRLGPFGWFRHAALRGGESSAAERSGNFGTLDTIRALEWVRENIAAFGGDPDNVTIFGESAGGRNVVSLLLSRRAKGLFHRAIIQSGGMGGSTAAEAENFSDGDPPGHPYSSSEIIASLLVRDGTAPDREAARQHMASMGAADLESYLRGKSHQEILVAYAEDPSEPPGMLNFPQVFRDGAVLPREQPTERLARGTYNKVPVILGTNRDENKLFMAFDPALALLAPRSLPRGPRRGHLPGPGPSPGQCLEGAFGGQTGRADERRAGSERLRLPLGLGRGAQPPLLLRRPEDARRQPRLRNPLRLRPLGPGARYAGSSSEGGAARGARYSPGR